MPDDSESVCLYGVQGLGSDRNRLRRCFLATTTKPWSSTAPPADFRPYVDASSTLTEFSWRAVILGSLFGILFGAVSVYVGLRAGLTVSASIPISVLSISILRAFGKSTILENNIVQTTGSAGESVAAGVIFTLPALIFLGFSLNTEYWRVFFLALIGGWLGVLFMIPLRRQLIVKEHGNLLFPEGTACADVLVAGDRGGSFAGRVFWGLGIGGVYTWLMTAMKLWTDQPEYQPKWYPGSSIRTAITSEYLGVGYIIGPRISGTLFAGGVFSWLVLMPAIRFFGQNSTVPLYPSTIPISQMTPDQLWITYVRPMGAGAVAASGLITLIRTIPTIVAALASGLKDVREQHDGGAPQASRLDRDIPMKFAVHTCVRVLVRHSVLPHLRVNRHFIKPGERDDDRDADGHLRDVPGGGLDRRGVCRIGDYHRRSGRHRGGQCGRDLAGPEDGLPGRGDSGAAADWLDCWGTCGVIRHRWHAAPDEQGPRKIYACRNSDPDRATSRRRACRNARLHACWEELRAGQLAGFQRSA